MTIPHLRGKSVLWAPTPTPTVESVVDTPEYTPCNFPQRDNAFNAAVAAVGDAVHNPAQSCLLLDSLILFCSAVPGMVGAAEVPKIADNSTLSVGPDGVVVDQRLHTDYRSKLCAQADEALADLHSTPNTDDWVPAGWSFQKAFPVFNAEGTRPPAVGSLLSADTVPDTLFMVTGGQLNPTYLYSVFVAQCSETPLVVTGEVKIKLDGTHYFVQVTSSMPVPIIRIDAPVGNILRKYFSNHASTITGALQYDCCC